ncbi:PI-PLC domain-containing protein [Streptomyces sp. NPDC047972]|uniref:PI-PLC domain-containing protein n=2 Tax=unclassified Streptomyces TaxID=2593676 RepID=UPI00371F4204
MPTMNMPNRDVRGGAGPRFASAASGAAGSRRARRFSFLLLLVLGLLAAPTLASATPPPAPARALAAAAQSSGTAAAQAEARWGDRRLDEATFLATHNAFTNYEDSRWSSVSQSESLRHQLDNGVRGLSLDTHWYERSTWLCVISFGSDCYPSDVYLCHGECKTFAGVTYALPRQSFHSALQTVVDFLNTHPQEVVSVFLEDYVSAQQLGNSMSRVRGLDQLLFRPDAWNVRGQGWPRMTELIGSGKRLLLFSDEGDREHLGVMYDKNWTVSNYWSLGDLGNDVSCVTRWSDVPLDRQEPGFRRLFTMSHHRNVPTVINSALDNGSKLRDRINQQCRPAAGNRDPNFVSVDFHRISDTSGHTPAGIVAELNARN